LEYPTTWFSFNETRRCSYVYGVDAVTTFLEINNLSAIIRAHEVCLDGYKFLFVSRETETPRVITIFSAPNYCDVYMNKAACIKLKNGLLNIKQFVSSPHPYYLPNFMDVFTWSVPFVAEKTCDILNTILSFAAESEPSFARTNSLMHEDIRSFQEHDRWEQERFEERRWRESVLKSKIVAVSRVRNYYSILIDENENIIKLKALSPSGRLPSGILSKGAEAIAKSLSAFGNVKKADLENMQLPGTSKRRSALKTQFGFRNLLGL